MKVMTCFVFLVLSLSLGSCSTGGNGNKGGESATVPAPVAVAGKSYRLTAQSGSGVFPSTGSFTVTFLKSDPWYTVQGDGVKVRGSWGTYSYSASGSTGTVKVEDAYVLNAVFSLTFNTDRSGTYTATADADSRLSGTFAEQ